MKFSVSALMVSLSVTAGHAQTTYEVSGVTLGLGREAAHKALDTRWQDAGIETKAYVIGPSGRTKRAPTAISTQPVAGTFALLVDKIKLGDEKLQLWFAGDLTLIGVHQYLPQLSEDQLLPLYERYFDRFGAPLLWRQTWGDKAQFGNKSFSNGKKIAGRSASISYAKDTECQAEYDAYTQAAEATDEAQTRAERKELEIVQGRALDATMACLEASDARWRAERSAEAILARLHDQELYPNRAMVWNCSKTDDDAVFSEIYENTPSRQFNWQMDKAVNARRDRNEPLPPLCVLRASGTEISMGLYDDALFSMTGVERNEVDF